MTGNCVSTLPLVILLALSLQFLRCTPVSLICHLPFLQLPLPYSSCPCHFLYYFELSLIISVDHHLVADCCLLPHSVCTHTLCNVWLYGNFTCWAINTQQLSINSSEQDVSTWRSLSTRSGRRCVDYYGFHAHSSHSLKPDKDLWGEAID